MGLPPAFLLDHLCHALTSGLRAQRPYARAAPERRTASADRPPSASAGKTAPRLSRNRPEMRAQSSQNSPRCVPTGPSVTLAPNKTEIR